MAAIVEELTIAAAPERVWGALTQPDEIGHWWTNDLNAKPEVGSLAEFRFGEWGDTVLRFEVAELDAGKKVHWISQAKPRGAMGRDQRHLATHACPQRHNSWSSRMMGSPRLMRSMNRHAGIGNTSWPA